MKYMFASDVHGSAYYCRKMLEAYDAEKAERLVLLGDLLYHGPRNDLPKEYAPKEVIRLLNERKKQIYAVRGNCEAEVDADPELLKYFCPKLSIQPLLENAIYHGMDGMYEDGEIEIRIYEKNGDIKIDVSDNGPGMTQEKIDYIMHNKVVSSKRGSGIGVCNVNERIQLIYGKNYGITISSELDEGTVATITIPKMEEMDEQ